MDMVILIHLLSHLNSYVIFDDAGPLVPLSVGMCHTSSDWTMLVLPEDKSYFAQCELEQVRLS